jgi:hypothetical protein
MTAVTSPAAAGRYAELLDAADKAALKLLAPEFSLYR